MNFFVNHRSWRQSVALPLAVFLIAIVCFGLLYYSNALDNARHGFVVSADSAVYGFLSGFRSPGVVRFFSVVTALGYWGVVMTLATTLSILLWLGGKSRYVTGLWIALAGNQISVNLLKWIFARPRSPWAYYRETSYSFPSGHSAVSAAFFGFLVYLLMRERIVNNSVAVASGGLLILLVGLSRLVLAEHYLSDVLAGYVVGTLWALFGIWWQEATVPVDHEAQILPRWRRLAAFVVVAACVLAVWFLSSHYEANLVILPQPSAAP